MGTVKEELARILTQREKQYINDASLKVAAVLIPIYQKRGSYYIVLIRRTETVKVHKGQISFPGGTRETEDRTLLHTAIRESREEIGLHVEDIEVVGELDDEITTTSNYVVTPFVAMIPWPYRFTKNKDEVAGIMEVPIKALLKKGCLKANTETLNGQPIDSYTYDYQGKVIWGATARILKKLLDIIEKITRVNSRETDGK
jgi:8-oxo-dGTP pyrophosphatase MutT (NUDIX family)